MASSAGKLSLEIFSLNIDFLFLQRLFSNLSNSSSSITHRLNTVVPKGFEKYFPGGGGKSPQPKDPGASLLHLD